MNPSMLSYRCHSDKLELTSELCIVYPDQDTGVDLEEEETAMMTTLPGTVATTVAASSPEELLLNETPLLIKVCAVIFLSLRSTF